MKKREHLFEAIGLVDDRLVEEAADARRMATPWKKWAALAACLVLVIGLSASSLMVLFRGCGSSDSTATADNATTSDTADTSDAAASPEEGGTESETAETTEDTAATDDSSTGSAGMDNGESAEAPQTIGPLTADVDGLTATRTVTITDEFGPLTVRDTYHVSASEAVDAMLYYPAATGTATYTIEVDGETVTAEPNDQGNYGFPLTLEAGAEAEVTVTVTLPDDADGLAGFELHTEGGTVTLTEQTVQWSLTDPDMSILENDFGERKGAAVLQPPETYRVVLRIP